MPCGKKTKNQTHQPSTSLGLGAICSAFSFVAEAIAAVQTSSALPADKYSELGADAMLALLKTEGSRAIL
jgi:hypothetical protein